MTLASIFRSHWFGPALLLLGSALLVLTVSQSELFVGVGILGVLVSLWTWRQPSRTVSTLAVIFIWSMLALALRSLELWGQSAAALTLFVVSTLITLWATGQLTTRGLAVAEALAISCVEVFFLLLFWPINFPSRALLLVLVVALGLEVIQRSEAQALTLKSLAPSLGLSLAVLIGIVATADWFAF